MFEKGWSGLLLSSKRLVCAKRVDAQIMQCVRTFWLILPLLLLLKQPWPARTWTPLEPWRVVVSNSVCPGPNGPGPDAWGIWKPNQHLRFTVVVFKSLLLLRGSAHETTERGHSHQEMIWNTCTPFCTPICVQNYVNKPGDECKHQYLVLFNELMSCFHFILMEHPYLARRGLGRVSEKLFIGFSPALASSGCSTKVLTR